MLPIKGNQKNNHSNLTCRLCNDKEETQEHVLAECIAVKEEERIKYEAIFTEENPKILAELAEKIIAIIGKLEKHNGPKETETNPNE